MIVAGALAVVLLLGFALTLPLYWAWSAREERAWGQLAGAVLVELTLIGLLLLAVLALASTGRWITFDRRQGIFTISRRPFGWRRLPRVVESRPLPEVAAVELVYGGVATETEPPEPFGGMSPLVERRYDWYEFNLVFRGSGAARLNVASGANWMWMREAGRQVVEFLGVPLIDQLYHGPYKEGCRT
jgi:hypothetical protein